MDEEKHNCPICNKELELMPRYPNYVCSECAKKLLILKEENFPSQIPMHLEDLWASMKIRVKLMKVIHALLITYGALQRNTDLEAL